MKVLFIFLISEQKMQDFSVQHFGSVDCSGVVLTAVWAEC